MSCWVTCILKLKIYTRVSHNCVFNATADYSWGSSCCISCLSVSIITPNMLVSPPRVWCDTTSVFLCVCSREAAPDLQLPLCRFYETLLGGKQRLMQIAYLYVLIQMSQRSSARRSQGTFLSSRLTTRWSFLWLSLEICFPFPRCVLWDVERKARGESAPSQLDTHEQRRRRTWRFHFNWKYFPGTRCRIILNSKNFVFML